MKLPWWFPWSLAFFFFVTTTFLAISPFHPNPNPNPNPNLSKELHGADAEGIKENPECITESQETVPELPPVFSAPSPGNQSRFHIPNYGLPGPIAWDALRPDVQQAFTLNGQMELTHFFFDESQRSGSQPIWRSHRINEMVEIVKKRQYFTESVSSYGPNTTHAFVSAFEKYPIAGTSVLVVGSQNPWVESICLAFGAGSITTVDFIVPFLKGRRDIRLVSIEELDASNETFDVVISFSSLEHDGLGRYGDPMNPVGDLLRMEKLALLLKPGGSLYFGVPLGCDSLFFNAHRVYGPIRFGLLTKNWVVLESFWSVDYRELLNGCVGSAKGELGQPLLLMKRKS